MTPAASGGPDEEELSLLDRGLRSLAGADALGPAPRARLRVLNAHSNYLTRVDDVSLGAYPALRQLNRGKGLGFTLFGTVISHHVLKQLFAPLVTLGSPLLTFLSLAEAPAGHCALSDAGALAFQATAGLVNETCTYNLTVGPAGVNAN